MTLRLTRADDHADTTTTELVTEPARWTCSLVNNMPDSAFVATERQYLQLLEDASSHNVVEVRRHTMEGVPRGAAAAALIEAEYLPLTSIREDPPDLLIITGSNPIEPRIEDEPYWSEMEGLLTWAHSNITSTLLSCLAAHAALKVFDGVERTRLTTKRSGVFIQNVVNSHQLTSHLPTVTPLPHSRNNCVPTEIMREMNYDVLIESEEVGWGLAARNEGALVLVQGHPEYEPSTLLREYRRDAGRFVNNERDELPVLPYCCVAEDDWESLQSLHYRILDSRDREAFETYPFEDVGERAPWSWRSTAVQLYDNLLSLVADRKGQSHA